MEQMGADTQKWPDQAPQHEVDLQPQQKRRRISSSPASVHTAAQGMAAATASWSGHINFDREEEYDDDGLQTPPRSTASPEPASDGADGIEAVAGAPVALADSNDPGSAVDGRRVKDWTVECDQALLSRMISSKELHPWATADSGQSFSNVRLGLSDNLARFSELTQGPSTKSLLKRVNRWRLQYTLLNAKLTPAAQLTHTTTWTNQSDLACLASGQSRLGSDRLAQWHDGIVMESLHELNFVTLGASSNAHHGRVDSAASITALDRAADGASPSASSAAQSLDPVSSTASSSKPSLARQRVKCLVSAGSAGTPALRSSAPAQPGPDRQLAQLQQQLQLQAGEIKLLREDNQEHRRLLATQAGLLAQQANLLAGQTQQSERFTAVAEARASQQTSALEALNQQFKSIHAFVRERL